MSESASDARAALVQKGLRLEYLTIAYNALESMVSLVAAIPAGSVALVGFGFDSLIELSPSGAARWRLQTDWNHQRREHVEQMTRRIIRTTFVALAVYVTYDSVKALWLRECPERPPAACQAAVGLIRHQCILRACVKVSARC